MPFYTDPLHPLRPLRLCVEEKAIFNAKAQRTQRTQRGMYRGGHFVRSMARDGVIHSPLRVVGCLPGDRISLETAMEIAAEDAEEEELVRLRCLLG